MDSLNPIAGLSPMVGMWLNCVFGGKGVGMINLLLFLIVGVFLAGQMVGRTPEYLGRKIGAREMKLAMIALLVHPILILGPTGLFSATNWGIKAEANPGAHGFSQIVYQYLVGLGEQRLGDGRAGRHLRPQRAIRVPRRKPYHGISATVWSCCSAGICRSSRRSRWRAISGARKSLRSALGTLSDDTMTFGCPVTRHHRDRRRAAVPARGGARPAGGAFGPIPFGG